ncbi:TraB/GumN family protein [Treponema pedis]|uniref:TraB n=1 Tax=Treponema pedis str. T A4 TaxID=1291379 RepID=S5ZTQ8_9SPIR|nr:TraB/GumN family protein [Treponema pedis]AGT43525.1 TraB [Treponema pedis str. T A4]
MEEVNAKILKRIQTKEREIILLGTAHVSKESIKEVETVIREEMPDCVCVELDETRYKALVSEKSWQEIDISKILKEGKGFLLLANLVLASFQKKLGSDLGVKPGYEMKAAIEVSQELEIKTEMVDRPIHTTLKRAWAKSRGMGRSKLLAALLSAGFSNEKLDEAEIEKLKNQSAMDNMMEEMAEYLPKVKEVLIDERDRYLASKIWESKGKKIIAVLGAGHLPGTERFIKELEAGTKTTDVSDIEVIPPKSAISKIAAWIFPITIIALIALGFYKGGGAKTGQMLTSFIFWNGGLAAIGALIALGHPLSILVSFLGAPVTTVNPFLGIGMLSGLVQAWAKKPQVRDMENLTSDTSTVKGWYKNRITKVLLVLILSSLGSAIGTFITVPALIANLSF